MLLLDHHPCKFRWLNDGTPTYENSVGAFFEIIEDDGELMVRKCGCPFEMHRFWLLKNDYKHDYERLFSHEYDPKYDKNPNDPEQNPELAKELAKGGWDEELATFTHDEWCRSFSTTLYRRDLEYFAHERTFY